MVARQVSVSGNDTSNSPSPDFHQSLHFALEGHFFFPAVYWGGEGGQGRAFRVIVWE